MTDLLVALRVGVRAQGPSLPLWLDLLLPPCVWGRLNSQLKVKVTLRLTVSQSVSKSWCRAPSGAHDQIFITVWQLRACFLWGAYSDERTGLSFVYAAGPCQRSLSGVWVSWYSRPNFTVSDLRLSFSSPPTTRRVTVEVFDPASTRACAICRILEHTY
jgi:hypothetical protein